MSDSLDATWVPVVEKLRAGTAGELLIGGELGHGGMAAVFLAYDTRLNRRVAIKVMSPALGMGQGLVQRFADEAVTMANLRHPNIIAVHSVRQIEDVHFFVMEFVAGRALDRILQHSGALSVPVAQAILWQVGRALMYAHRRGVIHRDIKPANILIDEEGNALVTDFGIAKAIEAPGRTQSGILVGTPAYMSPEQIYGLPVGQATDQYSLGVVAYEMLTGRAPFSGSTFSVMQAHAVDDPPPLRERRADLPRELERAVLRMMAKEPAQRFSTLRDALDALGARPLDDADPVRSQLATLATLGDAPAAANETLTPPDRRRDVSLSPPGRPGKEPLLASWNTPSDDSSERLYLIAAEPPAPIQVGDRFAMSAVICREQGTIVADRRVEWTSSDPRIARIDKTSGVVEAVAPGKAIIIASAHGMTDPVTIDVLPSVRPIPRGPGVAPWSVRSRLIDASLGVAFGTAVVVSPGDGSRERALAPLPVAQATLPPRDTQLLHAAERDTAPAPVAAAGTAPVTDARAERPPAQRPAAESIRDRAASRRANSTASVTSTTEAGERGTIPVSPQPSAPTVPSIVRDSVVVALPAPTLERPPSLVDSAVPVADAARPSAAQGRVAAEACARAVQGKETARLISLSQSSTGAERRHMDSFVALLRDEGAKLVVGAPVFGVPQLGDAGASTEFSVRVSWKSSFGGQRSSVARWQAEMGKVAGEWQLTSCRNVKLQ